MKIFLSYRWTDSKAAEELDSDFQAIGIEIVRDIRDLKFKDNLLDYMSSISQHDFALLLISDDYLKSENCMYEAVTLFKSDQFKKEVLPLLADSTRVLEPAFAIELLKEWDERFRALNLEHKSLPEHLVSVTVSRKLEKYRLIRDNIDDFVREVTGMVGVKFSDAKKSGYKSILEHIGYENTSIVAEILRLMQLEDSEDQLLKIRDIKVKRPGLLEVDLVESQVYFNRGDTRLALAILEDRRAKLPTNHLILNNLGNIISEGLGEFDRAEKEYLAAIESKPDFGEAYYNLARLQHVHLRKYNEARLNYEKALALRPSVPGIINNYALLLKTASNNRADHEKARALIEDVRSAYPNDDICTLTYATLLIDSFGEFELARSLLESYLEKHPNDSKVVHNYGVLLLLHFNDVPGALRNLQLAYTLDPLDFNINNSLGRCLGQIGRPDAAIQHLQYAVELMPSLPDVRQNLLNCLMAVGMFEEGKEQYEKLVELDSLRVKPGYDKLFGIERN